MEHAPLRPVPTRPAGPVDPGEAARHVASSLPGLDGPAATALSLVALVGRTREETADTTGLDPEEVGVALARARKALRRSMFPLPGSGWCERVERLVSDRLDDALEPPGPVRLDVHLRNCPRCVEHERQLVQATDALVAAFAPAPAPQPAPAPALSVVERVAAPPPAAKPFGEPIQPAPPRVRPPRTVVPPPVAPPPTPQPAAAPGPDPPREPLPAPVPVAIARGPRAASSIVWAALFALAVLLAVATVAIAVAGVLGGSL
jgi:hypothetical protein